MRVSDHGPGLSRGPIKSLHGYNPGPHRTATQKGKPFPTHGICPLWYELKSGKQDNSITNKGNEGHRSEVKYGYLSYYEQTFA